MFYLHVTCTVIYWTTLLWRPQEQLWWHRTLRHRPASPHCYSAAEGGSHTRFLPSDTTSSLVPGFLYKSWALGFGSWELRENPVKLRLHQLLDHPPTYVSLKLYCGYQFLSFLPSLTVWCCCGSLTSLQGVWLPTHSIILQNQTGFKIYVNTYMHTNIEQIKTFILIYREASSWLASLWGLRI